MMQKTANMLPAIEILKINKSFMAGHKKSPALSDVSLIVKQGEVFGFLGPNGAGKSTTIKLLMGFLAPGSGTMRIMGHTVGQKEFRCDVGYLSEFPCFYDHLSARETLMLSGKLSGLKTRGLTSRIPLLLDRMDLSEAIDRRVGKFSKGMKQRLGMANALVHDPQVFVFDEPMSGLDPVGRYHVKELILELKEQGKTIFFSSHILSDIEELCDRIGVLHKGHLLFTGELADFTQGKGLEDKFVTVIEEYDHAVNY